MPRNTEGLKRSARLRSESAMQRALAALQRMDASDCEINFRTLAAEAGVSTAWLYNQQELRDRIIRSRKPRSWSTSAESKSERRECLSSKSIVATLRLRIKKLEEKNRELTELLEHAYGVIAETCYGVSSQPPTSG
jgi:hypothetical protein